MFVTLIFSLHKTFMIYEKQKDKIKSNTRFDPDDYLKLHKAVEVLRKGN